MKRSVYFLLRPSSRVLRDCIHAVQVDFILLNNRQYLPGVAWKYWIKSRKTLCKVVCLGTQNPGHIESHAATHCAFTLSVNDYHHHHIINIIGIAEYKHIPWNQKYALTHERTHDTDTGCHRRNGPNFGRVFLMLNYTDITQNTYIQSWTVTEIMTREVWNFDSCYSLIDYQIHIETGRNVWFL